LEDLSDIQFQQVTGVEKIKLTGAVAGKTLTLGAKAAASGIEAVDASALTNATATITIAGGSNANNVTYTTANTANVSMAITGGSGDDTFTTGTTTTIKNVFTGGSGTNTFNIKSATTNHDIEDLKGSDVLTVGTGDTLVDLKVTADYVATAASTNSSNNNDDVVFTSQSVGVDVNLSAATVATGYSIAGADVASGGEILVGSSQADIILGNAGADNLSGGNGSDALTGGAGADTVSGGAGVDTITINAGKDSITGGDGSDIFVLGADATGDAAAGNVTVLTDLAVGESLRLTEGTGTFDLLHGGDGIGIDEANVNEVFAANLSTSGDTPAVQAMSAGDIIIDFGSISGGTTGIATAMGAADAGGGIEIRDSGGAVTEGDAFLYTVRNTANNTTVLGIVTEVGGTFTGAAETFELIAVSTNTLTSTQVATLVSIV
jgi:Ca2+-binding RTX toxin-like protein